MADEMEYLHCNRIATINFDKNRNKSQDHNSELNKLTSETEYV